MSGAKIHLWTVEKGGEHVADRDFDIRSHAQSIRLTHTIFSPTHAPRTAEAPRGNLRSDHHLLRW